MWAACGCRRMERYLYDLKSRKYTHRHGHPSERGGRRDEVKSVPQQRLHRRYRIAVERPIDRPTGCHREWTKVCRFAGRDDSTLTFTPLRILDTLGKC
ncbi:unnamed protein product [Protopolystoma xenopodis]|uniref:Uncharacterized protein n=1 Tax=Protopolystoma xenopodis TaxID=117903 RepID=A0A448XQK3_9PLAT|nr:unnamed protein product [Protopolystoma xenopodis]